jgi:molybdopterin-guanine dinucleotide biosynthesis protein
MAEDGEAITCSNTECTFATTGACARDLTPAECPDLGERASAAPERPQNPSTITFRSGQKLSMQDAALLLRKRRSQVIAIVGPFDSGKTSLVASVYDLFQEGPVGGAEFAESTTLQALELASHHSRIASGRVEPDSERTPFGKPGFYHLDLRVNGAAEITTMLLGDRAGEEYRTAADDLDVATEFEELGRADTISLLVDGERLIDPDSRHNVTAQIEGMLRAFIEAGVTSAHQRIALVLTKQDAVQASKVSTRVNTDLETLLTRLRTKYGEQFVAVELFKVAAAPKKDTVTRGTGVAQLLGFWLTPRTHKFAAFESQCQPVRAIGRLTILET